MKRKQHRTKYVVWFHNKTDKRDDEWVCPWAYDKKQAREMATERLDESRFYLGQVYTIKEARARYGAGWPF